MRPTPEIAVMNLGDQRESIVLETVDDPNFPGRLVDVERQLQQMAANAFENPFVGGLRQRDLPNVVANVEARIVHPNRMVEKGNLCDALAISGNVLE
jgi:hypothetical protein